MTAGVLNESEERMSSQCGKIESWGVVVMEGNDQLAGFIREVPMGTGTALHIDVPAVTYTPYYCKGHDPKPDDVTVPAFSTFANWDFVRGLTLCSEEAAAKVASKILLIPPGVELPDRDLPF